VLIRLEGHFDNKKDGEDGTKKEEESKEENEGEGEGGRGEGVTAGEEVDAAQNHKVYYHLLGTHS
jgi:hypothetical protein